VPELLSQPKIRSATIAVSLLIGTCATCAAAPVVVDGWRYVEGPDELHIYVCDRSDCVSGSRIFYHFDPPNAALAPGILRKQEAPVTEVLGEPSKAFSSSEVSLLSGQAQSTATASDGSRVYYASGVVHGSKWDAWLNSAARDQNTSQANLKQFEAALKHISD
jgi:hypothetical protein